MAEVQKSLRRRPVSTAYNQWTQFESFPSSWTGSSRSRND